MAANNQNKKKNTSSAKKKTTSSKPKNSSQNKRPTASKQTKKSTADSRQNFERRKRTASPEVYRQRVAIILSAVTAILLAATFIKGERVWLAFHNFLFGLSGICAYVWPLMLIYIVITIVSEKSVKALRGRLIGASLATAILSGIVHVFSDALYAGEIKDQIEYVWNLRDTVTVHSGGVIGAVFGGVPEMLFGKTAAAIVLIVLFLATIMFVTGGTLLGIYLAIKEKIDSAKQIHKDHREELERGDQTSFIRKKKPYVPVDIGPEAYGAEQDDEMYIDELVGNAKKQDIKPTKSEVKKFDDIKPEPEVSAVEPQLPLDEIIKKVNGTAKPKDKPKAEPKNENSPKRQRRITNLLRFSIPIRNRPLSVLNMLITQAR